jgi:dipeptidyl aminopeptidase/acylaminoacyl peptidase
VLIGDLERDAERLRRNSPVHRVAEMKVPVLVAQGRLDRRVAPEHADRFVSAARQAGVDIQRLDYEQGHNWTRADLHADFLDQLDGFMIRSLKRR